MRKNVFLFAVFLLLCNALPAQTVSLTFTGRDANNATGFSALPAGNTSTYGYGAFGSSADFWSATSLGYDFAYGRNIGNVAAFVSRGSADKYYGFSVRCVRD